MIKIFMNFRKDILVNLDVNLAAILYLRQRFFLLFYRQSMKHIFENSVMCKGMTIG